MSDRVPNMRMHNWNYGERPKCLDCGAYWSGILGEGHGPCPGKPAPAPMQAPRIEIAEGDEVAWTTAGTGKVVHTFDAVDNARIAVVHVAGWFTTTDGYLTRTDTGMSAALEIVAADLRKVTP